jgi:AraC-like DNA-binding protein
MTTPNDISQVSFKHSSGLRLGIELVAISELQKRASAVHFSKPQRADFYHLIGIHSGHTRTMVDFAAHPASAGHWVLVRPGQVMRYDFAQPWTGWLLVFRPESLFSAGAGASTGEHTLQDCVAGLQSHGVLAGAPLRSMRHALRLMHLDAQLPVDVDIHNELMRLQLAALLLRLSACQDLEPRLAPIASTALAHFGRFRQLLESDFAHAHQVQHYAQGLGMGEKTLSRACMAGAGMPAKECIAQRVALEAKRLLAHTTLSVQAIGLEVGFDDATNFVKFFKREVHVTPGAFRRHQVA